MLIKQIGGALSVGGTWYLRYVRSMKSLVAGYFVDISTVTHLSETTSLLAVWYLVYTITV